MHPEIRVALEAFAAYLAEVEMFSKQFHGVELHNFAIGIFHGSEGVVVDRIEGDGGAGNEGGSVDYGMVEGGKDLVGDGG